MTIYKIHVDKLIELGYDFKDNIQEENNSMVKIKSFDELIDWLENKKKIATSTTLSLTDTYRYQIRYGYTVIFKFDEGETQISGGSYYIREDAQRGLIEYILYKCDYHREQFIREEKERRTNWENSFIKTAYYIPYKKGKNLFGYLFD